MAQTRPSYTADDRSLTELLSDLGRGASTLMRQEMELAKLETKEQLRLTGKAGAMFGAAAITGFLALLLMSFAAAWGLAAVLPDGVAFLIVGLVYAVVAAVLLTQAKKRAAEIQPVPEQTVETLKEDVQWARAQRN